MRPWCECRPWRRAAAMLPLAWLLAGPAWRPIWSTPGAPHKRNDPEYAAARAAREAGEARREQGASLWRPTLQFSGTVGVANNETSITGAHFSAPGFGTVGRRQLRHLDQRRHGDALGAAGAPAARSTASATPASASSSSRPTSPISNGRRRSRR